MRQGAVGRGACIAERSASAEQKELSPDFAHLPAVTLFGPQSREAAAAANTLGYVPASFVLLTRAEDQPDTVPAFTWPTVQPGAGELRTGFLQPSTADLWARAFSVGDHPTLCGVPSIISGLHPPTLSILGLATQTVSRRGPLALVEACGGDRWLSAPAAVRTGV